MILAFSVPHLGTPGGQAPEGLIFGLALPPSAATEFMKAAKKSKPCAWRVNKVPAPASGFEIRGSPCVRDSQNSRRTLEF